MTGGFVAFVINDQLAIPINTENKATVLSTPIEAMASILYIEKGRLQ
jgi:hypothetical protein